MKRYKQKIYTSNQLIETECDICGKKTNSDTWCYGEGHDERRVWTEVEMRSSPLYESDIETEHNIDICPSCFENKLVPWIKAQKESQ